MLIVIAALMALTAVSRAPDDFESHWKEFRSKLARAPGRAERLAALEEAREDIRKRLPSAEKGLQAGGASGKKLFLSLSALDLFLEKIPSTGFDPGRCDFYRDSIVFSFSPRDPEPKAVPGEAAEALSILKSLCD
jgi:hypothetical protein